MFAGAAFTDQSDIKVDSEVVDTLVSLGVVNGYDDGSFKPNGTVTRAEMAKMIYVLRTGNSDASAYNDDKTSFTDIGSHWARGYIKYCQSLGIIAGKSNTKFVPNEKVSAQEAAKMLLVTLGYNAQKAGLVGTGWASKTNALADENGLLEDLNTSFTAACPRQYAAQLIYNTIFAPTVVLRDGEYTNMKMVTGANLDNYNPTVGEKYMGLKSDTGVITTVGKETFSVALDSDEDNYSSGNTQTYTKLKKDYSSKLGQKVKVLFKKTSDVIGVFATADNHVYTTVQNALSKDGDKIKFDGTSYSVDSNITKYTVDVEGHVTKNNTPVTVASLVDKDSANAVVLADTDDNNKIDTVIVTEVVLAKVTYVSTKEIIAGSQSYKFEDEKIADSIVKDDYVAVYANTFEDCKNVVKATKITGSINGTKTTDGSVNQYRIDDTWYNQYSNADMNSVQVGNKVDAWVYNGVVAYAKRTAGESGKVGDVCVIKAIGSNIEGDKVKIVDFDGKESIVAYDTDDHSADGYVAPSALKIGAVYEYEIVKNEYRFKALNTTNDWYGDYTAKSTGSAATAANVGGLDVATAGAKAKTIAGFKVNDNAKVILVDTVSDNKAHTADTKAITGKQLKTLTVGTSTGNVYAAGGIAAFTSKVDGLTQVTYAVVGVNSVASQFDTNDNYGYITDSAYVSATGYVTYKVWTGAEEVTVTEKKSNVNDRTEGTVIGYSSINADKEIEDVAVITGIEGAIKGVNDKQTKVTFDGTNQNEITADTKVLYVDTDAHEGKTTGSIVEADKFGDAYFNNVIYKLDGNAADSDVDLLVVDVKNKLHGTVTLNSATAADVAAALVSGDVTVDASAIDANVTVPAGKTLTLTGTVTATELGKVKASVDAKLVVAKKTASITSADVYTAAGSKTNETTSVAGTTLSAKVIKAGATFTGATVYTDTQMHTTVAWVVDAASMLQ